MEDYTEFDKQFGIGSSPVLEPKNKPEPEPVEEDYTEFDKQFGLGSSTGSKKETAEEPAEDFVEDLEAFDLMFGINQEESPLAEEYMKQGSEAKDTAEFLASEESQPSGDFARGLGSGVENLKATANYMHGLGADLLGFDDVAQKQYGEGQLLAQAAAKRYPPSIDKVEDIHGVGDAVDWAQHKLGQVAPDMAIMAGTSGLGNAAVTSLRYAARKYATGLTAKAAAKKQALAESGKMGISRLAAKPVSELGSIAGLMAGSGGLESSGNWATDIGKHGAEGTSPVQDILFGSISGVTEAFNPVAKLMPGISGKASRLLPAAVKGIIGGGGQETTQTVISKVNEKLQDPDVSMDDKAALSDYLNSMATGGLVGGTAGAVHSSVNDPGYEYSQIDKAIQPISSRLADIDPELRNRVRGHQLDTGLGQVAAVEGSNEFYGSINKLSKAKKKLWANAVARGDLDAQADLANRFGLTEEYGAYRSNVDTLVQNAEEVGVDIPSGIAFKNLRAAKKARVALGMEDATDRDVLHKLSMYLADNPDTVRARALEKLLADPGKASAQSLQQMVEKTEDFKIRGISAKVDGLQRSIKAIEGQEFMTPEDHVLLERKKEELAAAQKIVDDHSIYKYIDDQGYPEQQKGDVEEILKYYFRPGQAHKAVQFYKNFEVIDTLGSVVNAISQIGDIGLSAYSNGISNTISAAASQFRTKNKLKKGDVGIDKGTVSSELGKGLTSSAVDATLKATGLTGIDALGKSVNLTGAHKQLKNQMAKNPNKLRKRLRKVLTNEQTESVINDLNSDTPVQDLGRDTKFVLYDNLLKTQAVGKSEVPLRYLKNPNSRIFYLLKTFTIKRFDLFRRESLSKIATGNPKEVAIGTKNLAKLTSLLLVSGVGIDEVKSLIKYGKFENVKDSAVVNLLGLITQNQIAGYHVQDEKYSKLPMDYAPPAKLLWSALRDYKLYQKSHGRLEPKDFKSIESIPLGGQLWSGRYGYGKKNKEYWDRKESRK